MKNNFIPQNEIEKSDIASCFPELFPENKKIRLFTKGGIEIGFVEQGPDGYTRIFVYGPYHWARSEQKGYLTKTKQRFSFNVPYDK